MKFSTSVVVGLLTFAYSAFALPRMDASAMKRMAENLAVREAQSTGKGRVISFPGPPKDTGLKKIPDAAHPFVAPGPNDVRGPCPALNTLANHGYIPHNGIATPEQILTAVMEAFNMEHDFGRFVVSFATLARGNPYTGQLSIGGESSQIPHMPGNPDGPAPPGGIAKHGRFEGDVSISRLDHAIGDSVDFQEKQFDTLLLYVGKYGDDGPDGPMSVVNIKAFQEFKFNDYNRFLAEDPEFSFQVGRQFTTFGEVSFVLNLFANGTDGKLSIDGMGSIFRNQTFGPNWFRRSSPANFAILTGTAGIVKGAHDYPAGKKVNGKFVVDPEPITNFLCQAYADLAGNQVSAGMLKTTGLFKQNVDQLVSNMFVPFHDSGNCTTKTFPHGPAGA